ncbi:MAG: LON peptidase substrate-binding domain-containing protein [Armatimonadia bacterium]
MYHAPRQTLPVQMPIMPLNSVLFPGMPMPLFLFEQRYRNMIECCLEEESRTFGVALLRDDPLGLGQSTPCEIGTVATIVRALELDEGGVHVMAVGTRRFRMLTLLQDEPYLTASVELLDDEEQGVAPCELHDELREMFEEYLRLLLQFMGQTDMELTIPDSALRLSYMVAAHLGCPLQARQRLLEMDNLSERLVHEKQLLESESAEYRMLLTARRKHDRMIERTSKELFSNN